MSGPGSGSAVQPDDMDDDEALRYAIALSLQEHEKKSPEPAKPEESQPDQGPHTSGNFSLRLLDRKAMEEARIQRLAAKRPRLDQQTAPDDGDDVVEVPPPKKMKSAGPSTPKAAPVSASPSAQPASSNYFPDGVVKRTWARGHPRASDDIKIEEVFQKEKLELALISSFQWDEEWMLSKVDLRRTKLLLLAFATNETQQQEMQANAPPNVRFCFPPMNGPGAMHSKLQLLKYPDQLRIVVPTGNLVPYDWGETGVMENMVFLIDLPRLGDAADHKPTQFSTELARFLTEAKVDDRMVDSLTSYDFSRTERLGFVYSIGDLRHDGGGLAETNLGYCGLGNVVSSLGLATTSPIEVDSVVPANVGTCQSASLGSLTSDLITSIYNACQGDNGMKEYNARGTRKPAGASHSTPQLLRDHFRIYFPTEATVVNTRGGRGAAGTICVQAKWWRQPRFPTDLVRDCVSSRKGLLLHTKAIFVHSSSAAEVADAPSHKASAWAYVGSANLSESAWGRLVKDSKTGKPKLNCRNWECGVVVPVLEANGKARPTTKGAAAVATSSAETEAGSRGSSNLGELFASTVPMPMLVPGRLYGPNEEPWFYADS
ncbi:unnamed protein product [Clonostachys rosea f. rosea IK726]|uniref:PLD phosphodiesterase domain-containing protein n=2 Tax=Bionectria ochroleuca TaxID=29856 RepID=A0A0B7JQM1_BIOOC|nr:unnamed protein product [Clonostachys rosea f. rosea IK726]